MPVGRRYSIRQLLEATDRHFALTHRKLLVEYVLLRGINDSPAQAKQLAQLLRGRVATVNLLVWNAVEGPYRPAPAEAVQSFQEELAARGVEVVVRSSKGEALHAACGQLASRPG